MFASCLIIWMIGFVFARRMRLILDCSYDARVVPVFVWTLINVLEDDLRRISRTLRVLVVPQTTVFIVTVLMLLYSAVLNPPKVGQQSWCLLPPV
jgi:hypothetical protein